MQDHGKICLIFDKTTKKNANNLKIIAKTFAYVKHLLYICITKKEGNKNNLKFNIMKNFTFKPNEFMDQAACDKANADEIDFNLELNKQQKKIRGYIFTILTKKNWEIVSGIDCTHLLIRATKKDQWMYSEFFTKLNDFLAECNFNQELHIAITDGFLEIYAGYNISKF